MRNKSLIRLLVFLYIFLSICVNVKSQYCKDFHKHFCPLPDFSWYYNEQSNSAPFYPGQTSELKIIVYDGMDYYISICGHKKMENIRLRILEDTEDRKVLYDNARQTFIDTVAFSNTTTRRIVLQVTAPELMPGSNKDDDKPKCIGVLIASRIRKIGGFTHIEEDE